MRRGLTEIFIFGMMISILFLGSPAVITATEDSRSGNVDKDGLRVPTSGDTPPELVSSAGDASYSFSIKVPPAQGGFAPSVSLEYSSGGGNGRFGVGWSVSVGYPATIDRSIKNGIPTYDDTQDEFYFQGQKLIPVSKTRYRTRIENFWRIEAEWSSGSIVAWNVSLKNGTQLRYQWPAGQARTWPIHHWYLVGAKDSYGNEIRFNYDWDYDPQNPNGVQEPYLRDIYYGYSGNVSVPPYRIHLKRSANPRPDKSISYAYGMERRMDSIIEAIEVSKLRKGTSSLYDPISRYDLGYQLSSTSKRLLLQQIQEVGFLSSGGEVKLPAHEFGYTDSILTFSAADPNHWFSAPTEFSLLMVDPQDPDSGWLTAFDQGVRTIDVNGDGLPDRVRSINTKPRHLLGNGDDTGIVEVYINNGNGFTPYSYTAAGSGNPWQVPVYFTARLYEVIPDMLDSVDTGARFIDLNRDNLPDIVQAAEYFLDNIQRVCLNNGNGWDCCERIKAFTSPTWPAWTCPTKYHGWRLPDDLFFLRNDNSGVARSFNLGVTFAELDGDGYPDLIQAAEGKYPEDRSVNVWLNDRKGGWIKQVTDQKTGAGWYPHYPLVRGNDTFYKNSIIQSQSPLPTGVEFIDVNGDGLDDLVLSEDIASDPKSRPDACTRDTNCHPDGRSAYREHRDICLNTGFSFQCQCAGKIGEVDSCWAHNLQPFTWRFKYLKPPGEDGSGLSAISMPYQLADLNGDGLMDQFFHFHYDEKYSFNSSFPNQGYVLNEEGVYWQTLSSFPDGVTVNMPITGWVKDKILESNITNPGVTHLGARLADADGDGLNDFIVGRDFGRNADGKLPGITPMKAVHSGQGIRADLLEVVKLPTGGRIGFSYNRGPLGTPDTPDFCKDVPESAWKEEGVIPAAFSKWVVNKVSREDPVAQNTEAVHYFYYSPRQDKVERDFRGYGGIVSRRPYGDGYYIETAKCYGQSDAYQGLLLKQSTDEQVLGTITEYTYEPTVLASGGGENVIFQKKTKTKTTTWRLDEEKGETESRATEIAYLNYDAYGNLRLIEDRGDGTEKRSSVRSFLFQDTKDLYIVDRLQKEVSKDQQGKVLAFIQNDYSADLRFLEKKHVARGYPINATTPGTNLVTTKYEYEDWGALKKVTEANGTVTEYVYTAVSGCDNEKVFPCQTIQGKGTSFEQVRTVAYDLRFGEEGEITEADGRKVKNEYDEFGRLRKVSRAFGNTPNQSAYEVVSENFYELIGPNPKSGIPNVTTTMQYADRLHTQEMKTFSDGFGRALQSRRTKGSMGEYSGLTVLDGLGLRWKEYVPFSHSAVGFVGENSLPQGAKAFTETKYILERMEEVRYPAIAEGTGVRKYTYAPHDTVETNPRSIQIKTSFDPWGEVVKKIQDFGEGKRNIATSFQYDGLGRLISSTDSRGNSIQYGYDPRGNQTGKNMADWSLTGQKNQSMPDRLYQMRFTYDDMNQLTEEAWDGRVVKHSYDPLGREIELWVADDQGISRLRGRFYYDRDSLGNPRGFGQGRLLTSVSYDEQEKEVSRTEYWYNDQGLVSRISQINACGAAAASCNAHPVEVNFSYDRLGKIRKEEVRDGLTNKRWVIRYNYDLLGRLKEFGGLPAISVNGTPIIQDVIYDERGRIQEIIRENGMNTMHTYDDRNFLRKIDHGSGGGVYTAEYGFDLNGNITQLRTAAGSAQFIYDSLERLDLIQDQGFYGRSFDYEFDGAGNMTKRPLPDGEILSIQIDPKSNRIQSFESVVDQNKYQPVYDSRGNMRTDGGLTPWKHHFDFRNKIVKSEAPGKTVVFIQDASGRKVRRLLTSSSGQVLDQKSYFNTGTQNQYEVTYEATGIPTDSGLYLMAFGRRVAKVSQAGEIQFMHHDHVGSTVAITNTSTLVPASDNGRDEPEIAKLEIKTQSLPVATTGEAYVAEVEATGGWLPYNWFILTNQAKLNGFVQNDKLFLTGTPHCSPLAITKKFKEEYFLVEVKVEDSWYNPSSSSRQYTLTVKCTIIP